MDHSSMIIIASFIPGLGLWLLNRKSFAITFFVMVISSIVISFLSPWILVARIFAYIAIFAWMYQLFITIDHFRRLNIQSRGKIKSKRNNHITILLAKNLTKKERYIYDIRNAVQNQLNSNEKIIIAISGISNTERPNGINIQLPFKFMYLALTKYHLVLINRDYLGDPISVELIKRDRINNIQHITGIINDHLTISLDGNKLININISFRLREETNKLVNQISNIDS
jgi:hypothetical protein